MLGMVLELGSSAVVENCTELPVVFALTRVGEFFCLSIDDSAPGVAADQLARLTEPLFRADASRSRAHGGAGLGLAIAKMIVIAHGGTLNARASNLGGVRIEVLLPAQSPS